MSRFMIERYRNFVSYVPGEQPQDKSYIKLNTNESPYPASKQVCDCLSKNIIGNLRLYSDPECTLLREKLAGYYSVKKENVICSNGSDDILDFAFMAFSGGKIKAVFPDITYGFYEVLASLHSIDTVRIPLEDDFTVDPEKYIGIGGFIVIANPNAPTGISLKKSDIERIIISNPDSVVLVDEAYVDFGGESCVELTKKYKNVIVVMTYSKSRSLAGARLGFAIGDSELIKDMNKLRYAMNPYSVNTMTLLCAAAALDSADYYLDNCRKTACIREETAIKLKNLGFTVLDSSANFLFAKSNVMGGEELYLGLKEKGVLVRHFSSERIKDYLRITVGTKEQMDVLIEKITELYNEHI